LSGIKSSLELLENDIDMEKNGRYFTIAKNCTDHLMFLMNDILDFAQIEEKKIVLNFTDEVNLR
jgi:signal transduction histidine kinase